MIKKIILFGILGLLYAPSFAQSIYTPSSYWDTFSFRAIGLEEGLPSEAVFYTYEDSLGFMWIVTSNGLVRYDGLNLKYFSSGYTGGFLYEAHKDNEGNLWIPSTGTGIHKFNGKSFTVFKEELESSDGLAKTMTRGDSETFFIGMYGVGMIEFDGEKVLSKFTEEDGLVANTIWRVITDRKGRIWIGTDNGLSIYENGKFTNFTTDNGLPYNKIRGITEMLNGDIWIGTDKEGIVIFRDDLPYKYLNTNNGLSGGFPQFFAQNPIDSSIWIAHHGQGLDVYKNGEFENLTDLDGLTSNYLTYVGFSKNGTGYVGSESGLTIFTKKLVQTIDKKTPDININPSISVIEESNQTVWIGLEGRGFRYYLDNKWHSIEDPPNLTNGYAYGAVVDPKGGIWFSTQGTGIVKVKDRKIITHLNETDGLLNDFASALTFDKEGNLWVGSNKGINVFDKNLNMVKTYTTENGLPNNYCLTIEASSDGSVWYGSYGGGLTRFHNNEITVYDSSSSVFGNSIFSIFEHSNKDILIAGNPGILSVFDGKEMKYYDNKNGIPNVVFYGFSEDDKGNIWASSSNGIFRFDIYEFEKLKEKEINKISFVSYSVEDGLPTQVLESGTNATITTIHTGEILFASSKGTVVLNPETAIIETDTFFPYFDEFMVDEKSLPIDSLRNLTPDDKKIEISYSALNIKSPKKTKFRIKLDGIDDDWNYVGDRTTAYYDYLPDGEYNLHVSAIGPDGQWSTKTATLNFTVLPPFYKTWWFLTLSLFGFGGLVAGGVQFRSNVKLRNLNLELETQRKIQNERERISRELHDNVGSQITNLITGIEISNLHIEKEQHQKAHSLLKNLDSDARGAMTDLRETIWLLDKEEVQFGIFLDHLKGYLQRQEHYLKGMKVNLQSELNLQKILNPTQSLNLTRIIQEALNNASKYANAALFSILFENEGQKIILTLSDNGIGMNLEENLKQGNGITNMEERAKEMEGTISIKTSEGKGTSIVITV
ncbi:MAG: two-component regulator propeller domain-containing protein [Balneolaceae bacterium]